MQYLLILFLMVHYYGKHPAGGVNKEILITLHQHDHQVLPNMDMFIAVSEYCR